jgi:hypothetical protein
LFNKISAAPPIGRATEDALVSRIVIGMTIEEAEHYSADERAAIVAAYPLHERDARALGVPVLGSGRAFPVEEALIVEEPFAVPDHWPQITGVDFGWDHPFAAVHCAWDRDGDVFHLLREYREREALPHTHAAAIRPWGAWVPVAWPHDGLQHDKGSGEELRRHYERHGLNMLPQHTSFEDGSNGVEAGVLDMLERMKTGRWKVASTCGAWLGEFRLYHRDGGRLVKLRDDLISASRYALMMKRFASVKPRESAYRLEVADFGAV